jgi:hypothetical protein
VLILVETNFHSPWQRLIHFKSEAGSHRRVERIPKLVRLEGKTTCIREYITRRNKKRCSPIVGMLTGQLILGERLDGYNPNFDSHGASNKLLRNECHEAIAIQMARHSMWLEFPTR